MHCCAMLPKGHTCASQMLPTYEIIQSCCVPVPTEIDMEHALCLTIQLMRIFSQPALLLCCASQIMCVGGGGGNIPVTVCYRCAVCTSVLRVLSHWTLGAAAYPSKKLAMSVRRHTKVLTNGEG